MTLYIDTKPELEWEEVNDFMSGGYWVAHSTFGMYHVVMKISGGEHFQLTHTYNSTTTFFHDRPTLPEAKAAAQADYERRTAERFRPIALPPRMNAREGDGSVHYCTGWNDVLDAIAKARGEGA